MTKKEDEKKDYIINLRLSRKTYEKLKERAGENRETLSQLVRKTIDDSLEIMGDISGELFGARGAKDPFIHYCEGFTVGEAVCVKCNKKVKEGSKVFIGETKRGKRKYICFHCGRQ